MGSFDLREATATDVVAVLALLERSELPLSGVKENLGGFVVARVQGRVVGVAGLETYDDSALLRSVAVEPAHRGEGIAAALVQHAIARAAREGSGALYLLTTTASAYFERLGFVTCPRDQAPAGIAASWEFRTGCPGTAVFMRSATTLR